MNRRFYVLQQLAVMTLTATAPIAQPPRREPTPNDTLKSPEVSTDHHVTFRIYAPKASEVTVTRRLDCAGPRHRRQADQRRDGRLVAHGRPAGARLLQLFFHRGRSQDDRPEERHDQAGRDIARQHVRGGWRRGGLRGQQAGAARRDSHRLVSVERARQAAQHARLHPAWIRRQARRSIRSSTFCTGRRRGFRLEHHRPRRLHHGQSAGRKERRSR